MTIYLVPEDPAYEILDFSVTISEQHTEASTPTQFPIEAGGVVSDHVIHDPQVFSCVVQVTESPHQFGLYGVANTTTMQGFTSAVDRSTGVPIVTAVPVTFRGEGRLDPTRGFVNEMQEKLTALRLNAIEMTVITSARQYENMLLVAVDLPREQRSKGWGNFSLAFQQITTVTSATVQAKAPNPAEPRGQALKEKGAQAKTLTDEEIKAKAKSLAAAAWDGDLAAALLDAKKNAGF